MSNNSIITRTQKRLNILKNSTLDYYLSSTNISELKTIETELSDHKPIFAKISIDQKILKNKTYIHFNNCKVTENGIISLLESNWPESSYCYSKNLFQNILCIRPVIKLQSKANSIFKENIGWMEKHIKLSYMRKEGFKEFLKNLNLECKNDKKTFFNIMNRLIRYKEKSKIVKGIKTEELILYGTEKDALIKSYFEKLYNSNNINLKINSNGIYSYTWDLKRAVDNLSKSQAVGIDNVPGRAFKAKMDSPIMVIINKAFNSWILNNRIPNYLMKGKLILLSKDKSDSPTIENTRPITILPAITKLFESSILYNLKNITKSILFCKNQRGFTKGKSTLDNIKDVLRLAKIMKMNKARQDCPTLVFFDFIKAYDTVPRDKLLQKLISLGTPCNIVELINNMLMNFTLSIGKETIHTYRGLIQGSVLSPILFNLFINDLMIIMQVNGIEARAYADDVVCIWTNLAQTKQAIQIMEQWCLKNELKIWNTSNTKEKGES